MFWQLESIKPKKTYAISNKIAIIKWLLVNLKKNMITV